MTSGGLCSFTSTFTLSTPEPGVLFGSPVPQSCPVQGSATSRLSSRRCRVGVCHCPLSCVLEFTSTWVLFWCPELVVSRSGSLLEPSFDVLPAHRNRSGPAHYPRHRLADARGQMDVSWTRRESTLPRPAPTPCREVPRRRVACRGSDPVSDGHLEGRLNVVVEAVRYLFPLRLAFVDRVLFPQVSQNPVNNGLTSLQRNLHDRVREPEQCLRLPHCAVGRFVPSLRWTPRESPRPVPQPGRQT